MQQKIDKYPRIFEEFDKISEKNEQNLITNGQDVH